MHSHTNPYYPGPIVTTYPIHSSVLGGQVVTELDETGGRRMGYVYAGSALLASEQGALVKWQHRNPVTGSLRQTRADTSETGREELDPEGVNLGTSDPALNEDAGGGSAREREGRAKAVLGGGADGACFMDFMAVDCAQVYRLLDTGVAVQCPNNDCGPRVWDRVDQNGNVVGREFGSPFRAYADGFSGFLPPGAHYVGGGVWENPTVEEDDYRYGQLGSDIFYVQIASLDGGLPGEPPPTPASPVAPDLCAGRKGNLNYNRRHRYADGTRNAREHITFQHIRKDVNTGKSKYYFDNITPSSQYFHIVQAANLATFNLATGFQTGNAYAYTYAFPGVDKAGLIQLATGIPVPFDLGKLYYGVGRDMLNGNKVTNVNTVIVDLDCRHVITSYPGPVSRVTPITGTPQWFDNYISPSR